MQPFPAARLPERRAAMTPELPDIPGAETVVIEVDGQAFVVIVLGHGPAHDALLRDLRSMASDDKVRRAS